MEVVARRLSARRIEIRASFLLVEYQGRFGWIQRPPVPVDEILEQFLGWQPELDDLRARFGVDEPLHGITIPETRQVFIDERLDPKNYPEMEGRYNSTVAHEIGHLWLRHPPLHEIQFPAGNDRPWLVGSYQELESQADKFAFYLLMPRNLVLREWKARFGHADPLAIDPDVEAAGVANFGSRLEYLKTFAETHAEPFAKAFKVSVEAMRIRLQELKLLPES